MKDLLSELDAEDDTPDYRKLIEAFYDKYASDVDLFVWDFDKTITRYSTTNGRYNARTSDATVRKCVADPVFFRDLVTFLVDKGKKVAIASWNDPVFFENKFGGVPLILHFTDSLFSGRKRAFTKHNTVSYWPSTTKYGKNGHLYKLRANYSVPKERTLLFDDNMNNVVVAKKTGYHAVHVPDDENFTEDYVRRIMS